MHIPYVQNLSKNNFQVGSWIFLHANDHWKILCEQPSNELSNLSRYEKKNNN
jgi:hypothetical protein